VDRDSKLYIVGRPNFEYEVGQPLEFHTADGLRKGGWDYIKEGEFVLKEDVRPLAGQPCVDRRHNVISRQTVKVQISERDYNKHKEDESNSMVFRKRKPGDRKGTDWLKIDTKRYRVYGFYARQVSSLAGAPLPVVVDWKKSRSGGGVVFLWVLDDAINDEYLARRDRSKGKMKRTKKKQRRKRRKRKITKRKPKRKSQ
jgi:hypothetical protein